VKGQTGDPGGHGEDSPTEMQMIGGVTTATQKLLILTTRIVGRYLSHHKVAAGELPDLIAFVHRSVSDLGRPAAQPQARVPAVPIRQSVRRDSVICLECGVHGKALRRHLSNTHGLTPEEYRKRWNLRKDHPIVAPAYAENRSTLARQHALGRRSREAAASQTPAPRRRGRRAARKRS
jgi:MucR family transcriptional regulator, transcriptional regulator of exopolysaccharide biosynthesis